MTVIRGPKKQDYFGFILQQLLCQLLFKEFLTRPVWCENVVSGDVATEAVRHHQHLPSTCFSWPEASCYFYFECSILPPPSEFICLFLCSVQPEWRLCSSNHSHMCCVSFWVTVLTESGRSQSTVIRGCECVCDTRDHKLRARSVIQNVDKDWTSALFCHQRSIL